MKIFQTLPMELVYVILQYAGELRILKRKMTRQNMFQIVNDDVNNSIPHFIYDIVDRPIRTCPSIGYSYYWALLSNITDKITLPCDIPECILHNLITLFINDYNNYYLDDSYYHIEWFDSICYIDFSQDIRKEKKWEIESYRHNVFDEITRYYHEIQ
jgi:hypothetical protein